MAADDVAAWQDLAQHAIEPNPVFEAECLLPAATWLVGGSSMRLVVAEDDGRFFGCFPVVDFPGGIPPTRKWPMIHRPAKTTQVRRLRYDGTPLLRPERADEAVSAMLSVLTRSGGATDAGFLVFEAIDTGGPVAATFCTAAERMSLPVYSLRSWTRPMLIRRPEATYLSDLDGSFLREIARRTRRLSEKLDGDIRVVDRSHDAAAVDWLIAMEASGYKSQGDIALRSHAGEPEWFREMCSRFRETDRLLLFNLEVGDTVVASQLMLKAGQGLFGIQSAYDEGYSKFSPGVQLHLGFFKVFHDEFDSAYLDTCTYAGNETLLRLYPDLRNVETLVVAVGGPLDRFFLRGFSSLRRVFGSTSTFRSRFPKLHDKLGVVAHKLGLRPL